MRNTTLLFFSVLARAIQSALLVGLTWVLNSEIVASASPTTALARRFVASKRAAFIATIFLSPNKVQEPVVKSCNRVPIAIIKSDSITNSLTGSEPVTPSGPTSRGLLHGSEDFPAIVSTTGICCSLAKAASSFSASE